MNQREYQRDGAAAGSSALSNHRVGRRESPTTDSARGTTGHGGTVMVLAMSSSGCSKTFSKAAATISVLISQVSTASRTKGGLRRDVYGLRVFVMPFGKSDTRFR